MRRKPYFRSLASVLKLTDLWDGDVLLFRGAGPVAWLIQQGGQSHYSHAAMVGWSCDAGGEWFPSCLETREWIGSRSVSLESQVAKHPGRIDVYRVIKEKRPDHMAPAVRYMQRATGRDYGWLSVFAAAVRHLPLWRWKVGIDDNDERIDAGPPFCSQLVDQALRQVDLDPVPNKAGRITEPGDLARSALLEYRYTLGSVS